MTAETECALRLLVDELRAERDAALEALDKETLAKVALHETCGRLLGEIATRDAKIARLQADLYLAGRAIERTMEHLHGQRRTIAEAKHALNATAGEPMRETP